MKPQTQTAVQAPTPASQPAQPTPARRFHIRPFQSGDRQAVRDICVETCWLGEYRPEYIVDDWIWAEFWTRYFTDREPRHSWVLQRLQDGKIVGYLCGSSQCKKVDHYAVHLLPRIAWRAIRKGLLRHAGTRRSILAMLGSLLKGELDVPGRLSDCYTGTWHFNLLPEARGAGWGWLLLRTYVRAMREQGVAGIHAQTMSVNTVVNRLLESCGFQLADSHPVHAFRHADPRPIEIQTWVMSLREDQAGHSVKAFRL